ncbi:hypothetical protein [Saccharopolyspora pogona]|nr:hypothetical protein [Saccharopolyspora pogona]
MTDAKNWDVDTAADVLLAAEKQRRDRGSITAEWPGLDLPTAYDPTRA